MIAMVGACLLFAEVIKRQGANWLYPWCRAFSETEPHPPSRERSFPRRGIEPYWVKSTAGFDDPL